MYDMTPTRGTISYNYIDFFLILNFPLFINASEYIKLHDENEHRGVFFFFIKRTTITQLNVRGKSYVLINKGNIPVYNAIEMYSSLDFIQVQDQLCR